MLHRSAAATEAAQWLFHRTISLFPLVGSHRFDELPSRLVMHLVRGGARGHFRPVYANEILTLNCAEGKQSDSHHFCSRQVQPVKDSTSG